MKSKITSFQKKLADRYAVSAEDGPNSSQNNPGSARPDLNWQAQMQSGLSAEELRLKAKTLSTMVHKWQDDALEAAHIFKLLNDNGGKYWEMFSPILLKDISREQLLVIVMVAQKLADSTPIK